MKKDYKTISTEDLVAIGYWSLKYNKRTENKKPISPENPVFVLVCSIQAVLRVLFTCGDAGRHIRDNDTYTSANILPGGIPQHSTFVLVLYGEET